MVPGALTPGAPTLPNVARGVLFCRLLPPKMLIVAAKIILLVVDQPLAVHLSLLYITLLHKQASVV